MKLGWTSVILMRLRHGPATAGDIWAWFLTQKERPAKLGNVSALLYAMAKRGEIGKRMVRARDGVNTVWEYSLPDGGADASTP